MRVNLRIGLCGAKFSKVSALVYDFIKVSALVYVLYKAYV